MATPELCSYLDGCRRCSRFGGCRRRGGGGRGRAGGRGLVAVLVIAVGRCMLVVVVIGVVVSRRGCSRKKGGMCFNAHVPS